MPTPKQNDPDPQVQEIAGRFVAMHQAVAEEVQRIQTKRRWREFVMLMLGVIIGATFCAQINAGTEWMVSQILKP